MSESSLNINITPHPPELSIVILCYRAGESLFNFVNKTKTVLTKNSIDNFELILVGNYFPGSDDNTPHVVKQIARKDEQIYFTALPKKGMMGWDMKTGLSAARGKYIAVIDGDGQMPITDLVHVFREIKKQDVDIAKTYRLSRGDGPWRKVISFFFNLFFSLFFPGLESKDINSKPKIMTREFYNKLRLDSDDWFIDAEMMIQARRFKAKIIEIPTDFLGLSGVRKSFVRLPAIIEFVKNLIIYRIKEFRIFN